MPNENRSTCGTSTAYGTGLANSLPIARLTGWSQPLLTRVTSVPGCMDTALPLIILCLAVVCMPATALPLVVNTWPFTLATRQAWSALQTGTVLDAVEQVSCPLAML